MSKWRNQRENSSPHTCVCRKYFLKCLWKCLYFQDVWFKRSFHGERLSREKFHELFMRWLWNTHKHTHTHACMNNFHSFSIYTLLERVSETGHYTEGFSKAFPYISLSLSLPRCDTTWRHAGSLNLIKKARQSTHTHQTAKTKSEKIAEIQNYTARLQNPPALLLLCVCVCACI
jgi:hypothetical protein